MYYVYFALSQKNGRVYVGVTSKQPKERVEEHNHGSNLWSKNNKPFKLVYYETYFCKKDAFNRESFYKMGFGKQIKKLIVEYISQNMCP